MNYGGAAPLGVRPEKDRSAEDALESSDQSPVLGTALLDIEFIEYFGGTIEGDPGGLLPNGHRCQKDRNQPILSPREFIAGVTGDLEHEASVAPFVKETSGWWPFYRKFTEDNRPRREPQVLCFALPLLSDHLYHVCLSKPSFGDDQLRVPKEKRSLAGSRPELPDAPTKSLAASKRVHQSASRRFRCSIAPFALGAEPPVD